MEHRAAVHLNAWAAPTKRPVHSPSPTAAPAPHHNTSSSDSVEWQHTPALGGAAGFALLAVALAITSAVRFLQTREDVRQWRRVSLSKSQGAARPQEAEERPEPAPTSRRRPTRLPPGALGKRRDDGSSVTAEGYHGSAHNASSSGSDSDDLPSYSAHNVPARSALRGSRASQPSGTSSSHSLTEDP